MVSGFSINTDSQGSDPISSSLFGGNLLFNSDRLTGTFSDKITQLGITHLRYPGGRIAEDQFDITDPDGAWADPSINLSSYLSFCRDKGFIPNIIIPMRRYNDDAEAAAQDLSGFLTRLVAGEFGALPQGTLLELGNEFYGAEGTYSTTGPRNYGEVAARLAQVAQDIAGDQVKVAVQMGRTLSQNKRILEAFDTPAEKAAVDALVTHQYPWTFDAVARRFERAEGLTAQWREAGIGAEVILTEWNIGSSPDPDSAKTHDYGMLQNPVLLEMLAEMTRAGIKTASVWGIQQNTRTALGKLEGESGLFAAGAVFGLAAKSLPGMQLLDSSSLRAAAPPVAVYGYEDADKIVVFAAARDIPDTGLTTRILLGGDDAPFASVTGVRVKGISVGTRLKHDPDQSDFTPEFGFGDGQAGVQVRFTQDGEVLRLSFAKPVWASAAQELMGTAGDDRLFGSALADRLVGAGGQDYLASSAGNDFVRGVLGNDFLHGGAGDDQLLGGAHHDMIQGGAGNDLIRGGSGRDRLYGGAGNDRLEGGTGNDHLYGGDGNDVLVPGTRNDHLWGGAGADEFVFAPQMGRDRILDFEPGSDRLNISALTGFDNFDAVRAAASTDPKGLLLTFADGTLLLDGLSIDRLSGNDFIF